MADFASWLTTTNALVGLIITLFSAGIGVVAWLYRRVRQIAKEANPVDLQTAKRVEHIEEDLGKLRASLSRHGQRLSDVERRLETVATQNDLARLEANLTGVQAEIRVMSGMLDTLYKAAIRASSEQ